jgi:2-(1,2-epoxy-1,2-dihydrophenyl)acetyl-CoA isomerase
MSGLVRSSVKDGVARVELDDPDRLNAIGVDMARELTAVFDDLTDRDDVRVVLLTGRGAHFSAGGNLRDALAASTSVVGRAAFMAGFNALIRSVFHCPKPVVSLVRGTGAGGALSLILSTDIVLLARSARLMQAFIHVGLAPDCGTACLLERRVGPGRARELTLTGRTVGAEEALAMGLGDFLYDEETIEAEADRLVAILAAKAPLAVRETKVLMQRAAFTTLDQALDLEAVAQEALMATRDFAEGAAAFVEKRRPVFTGA